MIRILFFFLLVAAAALGVDWLILHDRPDAFLIEALGYRTKTYLSVAIAVLAALVILLSLAWALISFIFRIPSLMLLASRSRRRAKGLAALTRGMVAAGAGDAQQAKRAANDAARLLPSEPLTQLLRAQAAQLSGDRASAEAAFTTMVERPETRVLGLRGLHMEARRRGDDEAADQFAAQAHQIAALPWAGQAVLENRTAHGDWQGALDIVESNLANRVIDRKTANRQRAVLQTAMAMDKGGGDSEAALNLAQEALKREPGLVPAAILAGRLLARKGDIRRATKLLEAAWIEGPHPEIARVYLDVRPGDSTSDRLTRARVLQRLKPRNLESQLTIARAALDCRDFAIARRAMDDAFAMVADGDGDTRPTARMCLMMAQLEEMENGADGKVREWLAKASRAKRDPAWIADGVISDTWAPVSPTTGALDAFVWQSPTEQMTAPLVEWQPSLETSQSRIAPPQEILAVAAPVPHDSASDAPTLT